ncbi:hypothetical protein ACTXT7_017292 [Hymenolepis weldensis]
MSGTIPLEAHCTHVLTRPLAQVTHIDCFSIPTKTHAQTYACHTPTPTLPSNRLPSSALSHPLESFTAVSPIHFGLINSWRSAPHLLFANRSIKITGQ